MDKSVPPSAPPKSDLPGDSKLTTEFLQVARIGSAIGFGFMAASVQALNVTAGHFIFDLNFWTFLAFLAGFGLALIFWRLALNSVSPTNFRRGMILAVIFGVGAFLYPLRFMPSENLREHLTGLILAVSVLSAVGFVFLKIKRYLDNDYEAHRND